jgi:hydrogenase nickel incorporation protein HypB
LGVPVVQINTGTSCHLNATMVGRAMAKLAPAELDVLFVENVGNLVCPAEFDIGEHHKIMLLSVTEGDEKPLKYPAMFRACDALLISKLDLMPHTNFDLAAATDNALSINPKLMILHLSCTTGQGMTEWLSWLRDQVITRRK